MGFKILVVGVFLNLLVNPQALAQTEADMEKWFQDSGFSLEIVRSKINNENCYQSQTRFLGCIKGLDRLLSGNTTPDVSRSLFTLSNPKYSKALQRARKVRVEPTVDVNGALIGVYKLQHGIAAADTETSVLNLKRREDRLNAVWKGSWLEIFNRGDKSVNFDSLVNRAETLIKPSTFLCGISFNEYKTNGEDAYGNVVPTALINFKNRSEENVVGIGAAVRFSSRKIVVDHVVEGLPAHQAGISANDTIVAIDDRPIENLTLDEVLPLIRGVEGSQVKLSIVRKGETKEFAITRKGFVNKNLSYRKVPISPGSPYLAGLLRLEHFSQEGVCGEMADAIKGLEKDSKVKGLILDLRNNSGGLLEEARCIVGLFIGSGAFVVYAKNIEPPILPFLPEGETVLSSANQVTELPLVVLINAESASASEVVAGALQGHRRAAIVGQRSFGKGTVLTYSKGSHGDLKNVTTIKTIAMFYLPPAIGDRFHTNQSVGIQPDLEVYTVPRPSKIHKFAIRERDKSPISLPTPETASPPVNPKLGALLTQCTKQTGSAQRRYSGVDADLARDYSLFVGLDVVNCLTLE